jgi:hypothetical protein
MKRETESANPPDVADANVRRISTHPRHRRVRHPEATPSPKAALLPPRLIEPVPIEDDLCSGVVVEDMGDLRRLVFFADQTLYESGGERPNVVKRKIVLRPAAAHTVIEAILNFEMTRRGG